MSHELRPKLRSIEIFPHELEGQSVVCLRDPSGFTERLAVLHLGALHIVAHFDGTNTIADIQAEVMKRTGHFVRPEQIEAIVRQLDDALFLDSETFRASQAQMVADFAAASTRPARHAGTSYPNEADPLGDELRSYFVGSQAPAPIGPRTGRSPRAIVAPHIDFERGGFAYAHAYKPLCEAREPPELVIVLGTDHVGVDHLFTLTRKSFSTPLGEVRTDLALVDRLAERLGENEVFADEIHHRTEHSIEFQTVWLRYALGDRNFSVLPVLCGSMHRFAQQTPTGDPRVEQFCEILADTTRDRRVCLIAGADLAHVGPRFGDGSAFGPAQRAALERADRSTLELAAAGDADGFFRSIVAGGDPRRVCGTSPIYLMLRTLALSGGSSACRIETYAQCAADASGGSLVSIASMIYQ